MDDFDRCYASALRILGYRFNSAAELRRKLAAKNFDRPTIDQTISRLTEEKWLDDARFAAAYVRTRMRKRIGRLRIRRELMAAGVSDEIIAEAIDENVDPADERARAVTACQKRLDILQRRHDPKTARNKLTAYLLKQGYDASLVREIVKEIMVAHH